MKLLFSIAVLVGLALSAYGGWVLYTNNVERPAYSALLTDGKFEVRNYPPLVVAEVTRTGDRRSAVRNGFGPLAAYIFAKERDGDKIAMTAPVTQQKREKIAMTAPVTQTRNDDDAWSVRFIMPSKYALADLPKPENADVKLIDVPKRRVAAIRFSGVANDKLIAEKEMALLEWMKLRGMTPKGAPTYAYYNDPFTPGFLRRNEVMFDVEGRS